MKQTRLLSLLFIGTLAGGAAYAQNLSPSDQRFAREAAQGGIAEVKLGHLAEDKGESPVVKDFGKRMVTDHTKVNDELKNMASRDKINLPDSMDAKDQALYDRLSTLSGHKFDREYMHAMVQDHQQDVAQFRKESTAGTNPDIRNFASNTLPTLEEHLKLAHEGQRQLHTSASHTPAGH